jgi:hypothetical protein
MPGCPRLARPALAHWQHGEAGSSHQQRVQRAAHKGARALSDEGSRPGPHALVRSTLHALHICSVVLLHYLHVLIPFRLFLILMFHLQA